MTSKKPLFMALLLLAASLGMFILPVEASRLNSLNADEITAGVNGVRASNGLQGLQMNSALMAAAQAQSDYQASIGLVTHTGADGSSPTQRDMAAGYGGGAKIYTAENAAYLSSSTPIKTLIYSIWSDSIHWATMINPNATDCGVGATEKDGFVYYTLDVSYAAGQAGSENGTPVSTATAGTTLSTEADSLTATATPKPSATAKGTHAVQTATADETGRVVHVVQPGEALWSIAIAYGVKIADLTALNGIAANKPVYAGQKLVIHAANTLTPSPSPTDTEPPPTRTLAPTNTRRPPTLTFTAGPTRTLTPLPLLPKLPSVESNPRQSIGTILVVVCGLGLAGVLISYLLRKKQP